MTNEQHIKDYLEALEEEFIYLERMKSYYLARINKIKTAQENLRDIISDVREGVVEILSIKKK